MAYHEEVDSRGISHLVDERGRCATFRDCGHLPISPSPSDAQRMLDLRNLIQELAHEESTK